MLKHLGDENTELGQAHTVPIKWRTLTTVHTRPPGALDSLPWTASSCLECFVTVRSPLSGPTSRLAALGAWPRAPHPMHAWSLCPFIHSFIHSSGKSVGQGSGCHCQPGSCLLERRVYESSAPSEALGGPVISVSTARKGLHHLHRLLGGFLASWLASTPQGHPLTDLWKNEVLLELRGCLSLEKNSGEGQKVGQGPGDVS